MDTHIACRLLEATVDIVVTSLTFKGHAGAIEALSMVFCTPRVGMCVIYSADRIRGMHGAILMAIWPSAPAKPFLFHFKGEGLIH